MRRRFILPVLAAALTATSLGAATAGAGGDSRSNDCASRRSSGSAIQVVGLAADGSLHCFRDDRPRTTTKIGNVTGLVQDARLIGIDYRPATNVLYGVGNAGGIYTIDAASAKATLVSRLSTALQGTSFGVDFNPVVDRLRIVSDSGQNLRVNVADGMTTVDGTLNSAGPPPVNPVLGVVGAAYTNNDADPNTATTLFDLDSNNDNTVIQAPANSGSLSPTGKLLVDATATVGFDIYSALRNATTKDNRALASIATADGVTALYEIDLLTGRASRIGTFRSAVVDIAIPTAQR